MPDWGSPTLWTCVIVLLVLAFIWGFLERRVNLLKQGMYNPNLGWEKSNAYVRAAQGIVSLLLFATIGICFWLFGWKLGLAALILSFGIGAATS